MRAPTLARGTKGRTLERWNAAEDAFVLEHHKRLTCSEIAAKMGRTASQIRNRCWAQGLDFKKSTRPTAWAESELELLRAAYAALTAEKVDLPGLAARLGRNKANVCRKARELGLTNQRRPMISAEALKNQPMFKTVEALRADQSARAKKYIAVNGHPRGMLGKKHTTEMKEKQRVLSAARWRAMTTEQQDEHTFAARVARGARGVPAGPPRGSWKAGWREVGPQRCYFRSRWEANYARYLEWLRSIGQIKAWEHEAHTFWFEGIKRGCVSYLPDFKVTNPGGSVEWHEVKGWMDDRSKTTLARMAKYHPEEKLIVIREKTYREIRIKVSSLIPGWEA